MSSLPKYNQSYYTVYTYSVLVVVFGNSPVLVFKPSLTQSCYVPQIT